MGSDNHLTRYPNLLKGKLCVNPIKEKPCQIPQIKWECPPKFALDSKWRVAAGEESEGSVVQRHREILLEAVYPHHSAIPPSASMPLYGDDCHCDDSSTPLIPIIPIEEEEASLLSNTTAPFQSAVSSQSDLTKGTLTCGNLNTPQSNPPVSIKPPANEKPACGALRAIEGDMMVAAAAALTAFVKSQEQGSLIDTDLLIQFLSNPETVQKLINEHGAPVNTVSEPVSMLNEVTSTVPLPSSKPDSVMKKTINEHGAPANTSVHISGPKAMTPFICFPSSKPELKIMLTDEHIPPPRVTTIPIARSPLLPLSSAKPDQMLIKNLINEHRKHTHIETAQIAGSKPVAPLIPLPSSEPDVLKIKRLINEYGAPDKTGNEPMPGTKFMTPLVPFSSPKTEMFVLPRPNLQHPAATEYGASDKTGKEVMPGTMLMTPLVPFSSPKTEMFVLPRPNLQHPTANVLHSTLHMRPGVVHSLPFSGATGPLVKDINYYKSLIKQHGEMQQTMDHDPSLFGKLNNHLGGPVLVQNIKSSEPMPKHQKPCMYFNGSRGCRKGSSCPYQHIMSDRPAPAGRLGSAPSAKRMKLGGGTSGMI